jgi:hypothetical protein
MTVKAQPTRAVNPGCKESAGVASKETIENTKRYPTDSRVVESGDFSFQFSANVLYFTSYKIPASSLLRAVFSILYNILIVSGLVEAGNALVCGVKWLI